MSLANKFNIPPALFETIKKMNEGKAEYQAKVKALMAKRGIKSLADLSPEEKKDFFNTLDSMHKAKNEEVELEEAKSSTGYDLYHKDFSSAMQHAYDFAKKKYGIEIDPTEIDRNVAMGPRKPGSGKANAYRLLDKTGKKAIQVQVANLDNKRYELNMYKEDVEQIDEVKVGDKVSFSHSVAAAGGRSVKKTGTVHQIDGDTVHVKVKDKYGVMTHKKKASDLMKEDVELNEDAKSAAEKIETYAKALPSGDIDKKDFMKVASMLRRNKVKDAIKFTMSLDSDPRDYVIDVMQNNKINMKEDVELTEKGPGLWANIRAKRARGEKMRKPGEKGAPTEDQIRSARNEEVELTESDFKIGDDVICKDSGMEGEVVKIDEPQTGKYYTVKREDGKMVKYAPDELKAEDEDEDEDEDDDEEEMKEAFSPAQIDKMRQEYGKIKGIDPASDTYKKLTAMLDKLDLKTLQSLAGAKIKFVSGLAQNRVVRKMNEDVEEIEELNYSNLETRNKFSSDPQRRRIADKARVKMSGMSDKLRDAKLKNPAMKSMAKEEVEELDEVSAETAKSVAQKRDLHFRKGTPTETQKRRMGRGDWRADPSLHADKARQSAEKRGAKDVYDYNKKEEVEFDEASNPQVSMKRAGLSVERAKEVMRHQKEIGSIRKKREALRNSYDPSIIEAYKKMKNKKKEVTKDDNQIIKSSDKLSGKQEPIELDPELKEQKS